MTIPFGYSADFDIATLGTLTAVGVTDAQVTTGAQLTFQVTLASVGTEVEVRFEGSLDGTDYFNLDSANANTILDANGTTGYFLMAPVCYVRFRVVSITGGTPTLSCKVGAI